MAQGLFISVEGTDGSGKTTQIAKVKEYLLSRGFEVLLTREPGGNRISEEIRSVILNPDFTEMSMLSEMLLYAAARAQLVSEVVKPALESGKIVICDRFVDSTYAYQGYGRGIPLEILENVNNMAVDGVMPGLTLFFDLNPEAALNRRKASTSTDRIENENISFHIKVYNGYKALALKYSDRIKIINAAQNVNDIWNDVKEILDKLLVDKGVI